jgi:hypothetical protein
MKSEKEIKEEIRSDIEREFESAKEIVEEVLREDERARNDFLWLTLMVWQRKQQIRVYVNYADLKRMIAPTIIHRVCQVIQNTQGKYLPTDPHILLRRRIREDMIRNYFGRQKSERNEWIVKEWEKKKFKLKNKKIPREKKEGMIE